ncbi:hypothetical protein ACF8MD_27625, partial [Pseudomonas sp. zjy_8]
MSAKKQKLPGLLCSPIATQGRSHNDRALPYRSPHRPRLCDNIRQFPRLPKVVAFIAQIHGTTH